MRELILRNSLKFGFLAGISCFVFFLVLYKMQIVSLYFKMADIGIFLILIWASIWYYKRNMNGILHFYEAFSIGVLTNIFAALISGVLVYLFIVCIDQTPFLNWIEESKATLMKNKLGDLKNVYTQTQFNEQIKSINNLQPYSIILDSLFKKFVAGILPIGLLSMVMRKLKN